MQRSSVVRSPYGAGARDLDSVLLPQQLVADLGRFAVGELTARQHGLAPVAFGEELDLELVKVTGAPHLVGDGLDHPLDEAGVVGVAGEVDVAAADGEEASDAPSLNVRAEQYVGRSTTVTVPIQGGRGKVKIGDSSWLAEGADAAAGTRVKITGVNGTVLVVEPE